MIVGEVNQWDMTKQQKVQRTHPRAPSIGEHDIPDTRPESAGLRAQSLAEKTCGLPSVCHDQRHPTGGVEFVCGAIRGPMMDRRWHIGMRVGGVLCVMAI